MLRPLNQAPVNGNDTGIGLVKKLSITIGKIFSENDMNDPCIRVRGARQNNLKNIDIDIPLNRMTVVTGVSGSGKSSLAIDTLYAEGQRRYIETFSPYARQFMDRMDRPQVDSVEGIPPAIAIDRRDPVRTSRSTVGTMTELTDYVKLLFARFAQLHCESCGNPVTAATPASIWKKLRDIPEGSPIVITFPFSEARFSAGPEGPDKTENGGWPMSLVRMGFDRIYAGGRIESLDADRKDRPNQTLNIVVDRFRLTQDIHHRIIDSVEQAFRFGGGRLDIWIPPKRRMTFSKELACHRCNRTYSPALPNLFSFNSPIGACETCRGFGRIIDVDLDLVVPDPTLSIEQGAIKPWGGPEDHRFEFEDLLGFCKKENIPTNIPFNRLSEKQRDAVVKGTPNYYGIRGFFKWLETKTYKMPVRVFLSRYRSYAVCPDCNGARFKKETLLYLLGGMTIAQLYGLNVYQAVSFFDALDPQITDDAGHMVLEEVRLRLRYLQDVGLGYLTLDRQSRTLSSGEVQRVALASALGASLVNTLYVLDEPSIGLHPRDTRRLVSILKGLRDNFNTLVVVEHDPDIITESDFVLDLGPGPGNRGGQITYFGPIEGINGSLTGDYLTGGRMIPTPKSRRKPKDGQWLTITGASEHNLKGIDIQIPLGLFVSLTGVSGSGKSTLAEDILFRGVKWAKGDPRGKPGGCERITGIERISDAELIDQSAIGRSPRANALTYTQAFTHIRKLLGATAEAQKKNLGPGHFSFNVPGGRCDTCKGDGFEKVEMQFLSDVFITCPDCRGARYKKEILQIRYKSKNIQDIFNLTVGEALDFFKDHGRIAAALRPLVEVGLGYLRLGQPVNTLSGGEAQRLKLSRHLKEKKGGSRLFIFDEPSTGLHFEDIRALVAALHRLVDEGHSVLVIEHNMDIIKTADWVIDLGPEGGDEGGAVVAAGPPEKVAGCPGSYTGRFLKTALTGSGRLKRNTTGSADTAGSIIASRSPIHSHEISVKGAREHNLKDLSLSLPHGRFIALTGVSGSGKSTLAFDILFAEGQRRYLESLAPYVRQYIRILERPDVDLVTGLSPTVAIEQRISHAGRRSTVATLTEVYHFLRLLFSKIGTPHCPGCGRPLTARSRRAIMEHLLGRCAQHPVAVFAPKISGRKGFHKKIFSGALKKGFHTAWIDGEFETIRRDMALSRYHEHTVQILIGLLPSGKAANGSIDGIVDSALREGDGTLVIRDYPYSNEKDSREEILSLSGTCPTCGISTESPDPRLFSFNSRQGACPQCEGLGEIDLDERGGIPCPMCHGSRLRREALAVKIEGMSIGDIIRLPAEAAYKKLKEIPFQPHEKPVGEPIMAEILARISLMNRLGLSYLPLGRSGDTLSGGEAQRVRLAAQLGSSMTGVTYILDEPTIGLHMKDIRILIDALTGLKETGNTVIVVEHDEEIIRAADHIVDLGPGAGKNGGRLVASGTIENLRQSPASVTRTLFNGQPRQITSCCRSIADRPCIHISGAAANNLNHIHLNIPLGCLVCTTGVSGSGKSTLVKETLFKNLRNRLLKQRGPAGVCESIEGWERVSRVLEVDHSPIGRTPRSVPASYIGILSDIRKLFAATPEARAKGYAAGRFSFNLPEGQCPNCRGQGHPKVVMSFLPDVYIPCEVCRGKRFNEETLTVQYKGKNISEVLALTFDEAAEFFSPISSIRRAAQFVCDIGLGYLQLGQPSPSLSGGEAQRIKLAKQLAKPTSGHTLYVLDEPSTGLHRTDVERLVRIFQNIVDQGNTIVVIEHAMEIIKAADFIIDLGPAGGERGGRIVAQGSPAAILKQTATSHTARCLEKYLGLQKSTHAG